MPKILEKTFGLNLECSDPKLQKRRGMCLNIFLLSVGALLMVTAGVVYFNVDFLYESILNNALKFDPSTPAYKAWRTNDPPLNMDLYLFNWTNADEIENPGVKPKFQEVGPYRFKEVKEKVNISFHDNNTVSYMYRKLYHFDPENSARNLSDKITTINAVPLTVSYKIRFWGFFLKRMLSLGLRSASSLTVTKTAGEILFEGYEDNILKVVRNFPLTNVQERFGIFYGKNYTIAPGTFSMWTKNDEQFGTIQTFNNERQTNYFSGHCNDVKGSAGEFYPIKRKMDKVVLYSPELCKYAVLEYEKNVTIKGVHGYKYTAKNIFDNGTTRPENSCFCNGECIPSGVLNISSCRENSPSFLSMPHFYNADPYYTDIIEGLNPTSKHEFYLTMEPNSGIVMDIAARMQLNFLLQPVQHMPMYSNVPKIFVPVFYFDQKIELRDDLAANLRIIQNLPMYLHWGAIICFTLGLNCLCAVGCLYFCRKRKNEKLKTKEEIPLQQWIK